MLSGFLYFLPELSTSGPTGVLFSLPSPHEHPINLPPIKFQPSPTSLPKPYKCAQLTSSPTRNSTDKRTLYENYDLASLAIDEIVDDGIILETDPVVISSRVSRPPAQDIASVKNIDLSEQGLLNAWEFGKAKLAERMRQM